MRGQVRRRVLLAGYLAVAIAGCAPALTTSPPVPGAPRISVLEIKPGRVPSGCPIVLRFNVDASESDIVRGVARWRHHQGRSHHTGEIDFPVTVVAGVVGSVRAVVTPPHAGSYRYNVEVEDAVGRRSNVLREHVYVELLPVWSPRVPCEAPKYETISRFSRGRNGTCSST